MKNKFIAYLSIASLVLASCEKNDDATGKSVLPVNTGVVASIATGFSTSSNNIVDEADEDVFPITVTLSKTQPVDVYLDVLQTGGTATEGEDFELGRILIPANSLTGSGSVTILSDELTELAETLEISIADKPSNVDVTMKSASFTINNFLSDELHLDFKYNKAIQYGGVGGVSVSSTLCTIAYDLDFLLLDASFSDTGDYQAAGVNCEESMVLDASLADGTYFIVPDLFDNGNINGGANSTTDGLTSYYHLPFTVPISIDISKAGGINATNYALNSAYFPVSTMTPANYASIAAPILQIDKTTVGGKAFFSLSNPDTAQSIASGRTSSSSVGKVNFAKKIAAIRANNPNKK